MYFKKALSPVVATALLLVVSVTAVVGFQSWFQNYSGTLFNNVEQNQQSMNAISVEKAVNDNLYLNSKFQKNISSLQIKNSKDKILCSFSQSKNPTNSLVGEWSFDKKNSTTIFDTSGNNNSGTIKNTVSFSNGVWGDSARFQEKSDHINIPDDSTLDLPNNLSISFWIKINSFTSSYANHPIAKWKNYTDNPNYVLYLFGDQENPNNKSIRMYGEANESWSPLSKYYRPSSNQWIHLGLTQNTNSGTSIYVDGKLDSNKPYLGELATNNYDLEIGAFNGSLDEVRIYNRTLSSKEFENLYHFNKLNLNFSNGINALDLSNCNLTKENQYSVLIETDSGIIEKKIIAR